MDRGFQDNKIAACLTAHDIHKDLFMGLLPTAIPIIMKELRYLA